MNNPTYPHAFAGDTSTPLSFIDVVRMRHSCRGFLPQPVPDAVIEEVLKDAQCAPSNCNTQPWATHIVSGAKASELSQALLKAAGEARYSPDFPFDQGAFSGRYAERIAEQGKAYYGALCVARDDEQSRNAAVALNYRFFDAPHVALLFMPTAGDNVRVAGDIGMYGQNLLLSLVARGLGGVPQTSLGFFAATIREVLDVPTDMKLLFGISFGYPDPKAPGNSFAIDHDPIARNVSFHR
jgi:nitroreductase